MNVEGGAWSAPHSTVLLVVLQATLNVLADSLRREGSSCHTVNLGLERLLHRQSFPLGQHNGFHLLEILGSLTVLEGLNTLNFILLNVDFEGCGATLSAHILSQRRSIYYIHTILLGYYTVALGHAHQHQGHC